MNMQYARAVLAHEQAYRDRARAGYAIMNQQSMPTPALLEAPGSWTPPNN